ncbi:MAG: hypothetical protein P1P76_01435 [Anaerolineales bacterium]|nr:hypothetical protein [Anaerolineales bacterium]
MEKKTKLGIIFLGIAWPAIGLGFLSIHFKYLPSGLNLASQALGLFLAGVLSGLLYLTVRRVFASVLSRSLLNIGYLLFAPVGLMAALLAPGIMEEAGTPSSFMFITPIMIVLYSGTAIAAGLGLTGSLAIVANIVSERFQPQMNHSNEQNQLQK